MIDPNQGGSPDRPVSYPGYAGLSWLSESELSWLIGMLPDFGLFIEVGSASGVTAARIADARPGLRILCVDNFCDSDDPRVAESEPGRLSNWKANRRPNMTLWLDTFERLVALNRGRRAWDPEASVASTFEPPGLSAEFVLVDAGHEVGEAYSDLCLADRVLARDGSIFAHDCDEPGHPGVTVAVDRFCKLRGFETIGQHWTLRALRRP